MEAPNPRKLATISRFAASGVPAAQPDDEVDAVHLHARRRLGQALELHVAQADVHERAAVEIVEVVMSVDVRIEPAAIVAH